jgi:hypothetical protein
MDKNEIKSLIEKAKKDAAFRTNLINDPIGAVKKEGYSITPDQEIILAHVGNKVNGCYLAYG